MFRGTAGNLSDVYEAWINGSNALFNDPDCMHLGSLNCYEHYRNTHVTNWTSLGITQVNYINGTRVSVCTQSEMVDPFIKNRISCLLNSYLAQQKYAQ